MFLAPSQFSINRRVFLQKHSVLCFFIILAVIYHYSDRILFQYVDVLSFSAKRSSAKMKFSPHSPCQIQSKPYLFGTSFLKWSLSAHLISEELSDCGLFSWTKVPSRNSEQWRTLQLKCRAFALRAVWDDFSACSRSKRNRLTNFISACGELSRLILSAVVTSLVILPGIRD